MGRKHKRSMAGLAVLFPILYVFVHYLPQTFVEKKLWFLAGVNILPGWALLVLFLLAFAISRLKFSSFGRPWSGPLFLSPFVQSLALFFLFLFAFFFLRDRSYAVGDAPFLKDLINSLFFEYTPHTPLWNLICRSLVIPLYHASGVAPTTLYSLLVAFLGSITFAVLWYLSCNDNTMRSFVLLLYFGQGVQILFGQLEIYASGFCIVALYSVSAWRFLSGRGNWAGVVLSASMAVAVGVWNLLLVPSFCVVLMRIFCSQDSFSKRLNCLIVFVLLAILPFVAVGGLPGVWFGLKNRDPLHASGFTVFSTSPDALWSPWTFEHLVGILNIGLALALPMLVWLIAIPRSKYIITDKRYAWSFTAALFIPYTLLLLIWFPGWGYRTDADLFSFWAPAAAFLIAVLRPMCSWRSLPGISRFVLLMAILPTLATVTANAGIWRDDWTGTAYRAIERFYNPDCIEQRLDAAILNKDFFSVFEEEIAACPEKTGEVLAKVDEKAIESLIRRPPIPADEHGWAVDFLSLNADETLILDCWGRLIRIEGDSVAIAAQYPHPHPSKRFVAFTVLPESEEGADKDEADGVFALLAADGELILYNPSDLYPWHFDSKPFRSQGFPPHLRAVDVRWDSILESPIILDNEGRLHVTRTREVLEPTNVHVNMGLRLLRNPYATDAQSASWCYITRVGRLAETTVAFDPAWHSPFAHFIVADALLVDGGNGALLLDVVGGIHPINTDLVIEPFYPLPSVGRFVRMALSSSGQSVKLVDRCYRIVELALSRHVESIE